MISLFFSWYTSFTWPSRHYSINFYSTLPSVPTGSSLLISSLQTFTLGRLDGLFLGFLPYIYSLNCVTLFHSYKFYLQAEGSQIYISKPDNSLSSRLTWGWLSKRFIWMYNKHLIINMFKTNVLMLFPGLLLSSYHLKNCNSTLLAPRTRSLEIALTFLFSSLPTQSIYKFWWFYIQSTPQVYFFFSLCSYYHSGPSYHNYC